MRYSETKLINEVMQQEFQQFGKMLGAAEAREAFMAFFQKRKPDFSQFS